MEPWRLLSRGQHDGLEVLPRGSGEASLPRPPAPACRSTPPSPRQMQGAAGCVCRQNRTCYPTLPPPGHLAEDVAVWVSDPGQVWKRDRAFKGMGWGREGGPCGRRAQHAENPLGDGWKWATPWPWTLAGQTQGHPGMATLRKQEGAAPALPPLWRFVHLLETELPPSCPAHKSTVCAHGVVLASGTRYLGGGPSGQ